MKNVISYTDFAVNERFIGVEPKDDMRLSDIKTKSKGSKEKELQLTRQMAKSITDFDKAIRRGRAADKSGATDLADIFFERAKQLAA